jgi:16S rRNA (adenine1518-N6/adenine1519-N6)-dimethyltransferase
MKARKRFGQHFLHDPGVLDRIARSLSPSSKDAVVEIGPGRGALTRLLLDSDCRSLDAIEIDRDLVPLLRDEFAADSRFAVHEADALDFDFTALAQSRGGAKLRVIGNLPYNISTPLLFHLLKHVTAVEDMHVMLQREVVNRIAAEPGNGDYGRLTVMLSPWLQAETLFDVGPGAFQPPPKVWSSVVRLTVRQTPAFAVSPHFAAVVSSAFSHRRKTLRNALKGVVTAAQIESCNVDPNARPETVAPEAFNRLAQSLA